MGCATLHRHAPWTEAPRGRRGRDGRCVRSVRIRVARDGHRVCARRVRSRGAMVRGDRGRHRTAELAAADRSLHPGGSRRPFLCTEPVGVGRSCHPGGGRCGRRESGRDGMSPHAERRNTLACRSWEPRQPAPALALICGPDRSPGLDRPRGVGRGRTFPRRRQCPRTVGRRDRCGVLPSAAAGGGGRDEGSPPPEARALRMPHATARATATASTRRRDAVAGSSSRTYVLGESVCVSTAGASALVVGLSNVRLMRAHPVRARQAARTAMAAASGSSSPVSTSVS